MSLDDSEFSSFSGFGLSGIDGGPPQYLAPFQKISHDKPRTVVTKLTMGDGSSLVVRPRARVKP
jgi:hypothetical protein